MSDDFCHFQAKKNIVRARRKSVKEKKKKQKSKEILLKPWPTYSRMPLFRNFNYIYVCPTNN